MILSAKHWKYLNVWGWPNFTPQECACHHCGEINIETQLLDKLEQLRERLNKQIRLNCAYRCAIHNARVGGAPLSQHKLGTAVDISTKFSVTKQDLIEGGKALGFTGIGHKDYPAWVHLDIRPQSFITYW